MFALLIMLIMSTESFCDEKNDANQFELGKQIYLKQCANCHGQDGEGNPQEYESPLYGDQSLSALVKIIDETMPSDKANLCKGKDAEAVGRYIFETFYTEYARQRNAKPRIELSRLTVNQLRNCVADAMQELVPQRKIDKRGGLYGTFYKSRNANGKSLVFHQINSGVDFQFGEKSPVYDPKLDPLEKPAKKDPEINAREFSAQWNGALLADETGEYEFIVKSENGFRLFVNDTDQELIDGWVSSSMHRELRGTVFLIGGRAYPIKLEFFKYKDKTASINLSWKPPMGAESTIPARNLSPSSARSVLVVQSSFPPDDQSVGYVRGNSVSKNWSQSVTRAAVEVAELLALNMSRYARIRDTDSKRTEKVISFIERFAELAFRRTLTESQKQIYVKRHFQLGLDEETAIKRSVLLILKSPRFLYTEGSTAKIDDFTRANRMSLALWDSIPDRSLMNLARGGKLKTESQIARQAERMVADPRTRAKMREFYNHFLQLERAANVAKDKDSFPGFSQRTLSDLRASLFMFLDEATWGEDSDFRNLYQENRVYLNKELAEFYGAKWEESSNGFSQVEVDSKFRAGILTHPYLMSVFAYNQSTSPIHRGVFVTRRLLGRRLNPPPEATEFKEDHFDPKMTMREKVAELTRAEQCQTCHRLINPLGFSLENFDGVGRFQKSEKNKTIKTEGVFETIDGKKVTIKNARDLANHLAQSEQSHRSFVRNLFEHLIKQPPAAYGDDTIDKLVKSFQKSEYNIRKLTIEIVKTATLYQSQDSANKAKEE